MKVKDILNRVTTRYNDADYTRVSFKMYLSFLDDAINQLILARPDANVKTAIVKLVPGTRQTLPTDGYALIDISRNMIKTGANSYSEGAPILQTERSQLDMFSNWHQATPVDYVEQYSYVIKSPKTFWVSNPIASSAEVYVELDYSHGVSRFADLTDADEVIMEQDVPLDDIFLGPLVAYVLYLLFSTDSSSSIDAVTSQRYEQSFYQSLGLEYQATALVQPKINQTEIPRATTA